MEWVTDGANDCLPNHESPIQNFTSGLKQKCWKVPHADSGQNSLEYWDYTVELELLKGPQDLQLAAELGKTLLERNRELESNIKHLQAVIDDQTQEIVYLSKQTAALREVNDSRLRIYEQLEISIQDLEKNNQRLTAESNADKKKIINLSDTVEQLEAKCEDLQKALEEAKLTQQRGRNTMRNAVLAEENLVRRSMSCENNSQISDDLLSECAELKMKYESSLCKIKFLQEEKLEEIRRREDLEIEMSCLSQENTVLQEQLMILKEKNVNFKTFDDELASLNDTTTSSMLCKKCMGAVDETGSQHTMQDFGDDFDDLEASYDSIHGECALVKLKNGGCAWGSQESLASMGQVVNCVGSNNTSPRSEIMEPPPNSLLSELDTQYRILIEKYEALVETREEQQRQQLSGEYNQVIECPQRLIHPCVDDVSGHNLSLVMADITRNPNVSLRCQRCSTCNCGFKFADSRPKSNAEEFSEVETSSSGFSEGESRHSCKFTQTEGEEDRFNDEMLTPTPFASTKCLDLSSPLNPCERRFQNMPIYKQLFQEIFEVLKKSVDENEAKMAFTRSIMQSHQLVNMTEMVHHVETFTKTFSRSPSTEPVEPTEEDKKALKEEINQEKDVCKVEKTGIDLGGVEDAKDSKLTRPDFLDLCDPSRSSSSQRRRKRNRPRHSSPLRVDQKADASREVTKVSKVSKKKSMSTSSEDPKKHSGPDPITDAPSTSSSMISAPDGEKKSVVESKKSYNENVTNSVIGKCEHKSRLRKNKKSKNPTQPINKHLNNVTSQKSPRPSQPRILLPREASKSTVFKRSHPSVEVAKLIKLEMSYAEVLKKLPNRGQSDHKFY